MKRQRLKTISITASIFVVAVAAASLFVYEITEQSRTLRQQVTTLQKDQAQQAQLAQLKKLITETEQDRTKLRTHYLASQSDSIDFLNYIERLAQTQSVLLETKGATEVERGSQQRLLVQYNLSGTRLQLERFIQLLENVPYVSEVTEVTLQSRSEPTWQAAVTMEVVILSGV